MGIYIDFITQAGDGAVSRAPWTAQERLDSYASPGSKMAMLFFLTAA